MAGPACYHPGMTTRREHSFGNWILFGFTAQHAVISYFLGLLSMITFFTHAPRFEGAGILSLRLRDWFSKKSGKDEDGTEDKGFSRYSSTLFRTIFWHESRPVPETIAEELDSRHERHERKHIHQFEDACVQGFFLGMALASCLWVFGWHTEAWQPALVWELTWLLMPLMLTATWFTALLRYGPSAKVRPNGEKRTWFARLYDTAYLDSEIERSARSQTEGRVNGKNWAEREFEARH